MKKAICASVLMVLLVSCQVWAFDASSGTKELTASGQAVTGGCWITGLQIVTDGTNAATVTLYDGTGTSGKKIGTFWLPGALYGDRYQWTFPRRCESGIYLSLSGTGASAIIEYRK